MELIHDESLSNFAFHFNVCRYNKETADAAAATAAYETAAAEAAEAEATAAAAVGTVHEAALAEAAAMEAAETAYAKEVMDKEAAEVVTGLLDSARHVTGCHKTQEMRVRNACVDVTVTMHRWIVFAMS